VTKRAYFNGRKACVDFFKAQVWSFCLVHFPLAFQLIRATSINNKTNEEKAKAIIPKKGRLTEASPDFVQEEF
jgi:hypothetical protein